MLLERFVGQGGPEDVLKEKKRNRELSLEEDLKIARGTPLTSVPVELCSRT